MRLRNFFYYIQSSICGKCYYSSAAQRMPERHHIIATIMYSTLLVFFFLIWYATTKLGKEAQHIVRPEIARYFVMVSKLKPKVLECGVCVAHDADKTHSINILFYAAIYIDTYQNKESLEVHKSSAHVYIQNTRHICRYVSICVCLQ